jgi:hypothetical protein
MENPFFLRKGFKDPATGRNRDRAKAAAIKRRLIEQ